MNKNYLHIAALALAILCAAGCIKNDFSPSSLSTPVLFVRGSLDGEPFQIEAGSNGFIQTTEFDRNRGGVYEYTAHFEQANADGGRFEVILLDDAQYFPGEMIDPLDALQAGSYEWVTQKVETNPLKLQFYPSSIDATSYNWIINGEERNELRPTFTFDNIGGLEAILKVQNGSCTDSLHRSTFVFDSNVPFFSYETFSNQWIEDETVKLEINNYDPSIHGIVEWEIESAEGNQWQESGESVTVTFESEGPHLVRMRVLDENNNYSSTDSRKIFAGPNPPPCAANFEYEQFAEHFDVSKAIIHYTAPSGEQYRSYKDGPTVQTGSFNILESEPFLANPEDDRSTYRVTFSASCTLYNLADPSESILLNITDGSTAFVYDTF